MIRRLILIIAYKANETAGFADLEPTFYFSSPNWTQILDKQEFLLLIPAIIYGVAIIDLLKVFGHQKNYWEVVSWGLLLMIIIINMWMDLYHKLGSFVDSNINFFLINAQAIIYARAAAVITPEEKDVDTRQYFFDIKKSFFLILAASGVMNLIVQYTVFDDQFALWVRPLGIILFAGCAFYSKLWFRTAVLIFVSALALTAIFVSRDIILR